MFQDHRLNLYSLLAFGKCQCSNSGKVIPAVMFVNYNDWDKRHRKIYYRARVRSQVIILAVPFIPIFGSVCVAYESFYSVPCTLRSSVCVML